MDAAAVFDNALKRANAEKELGNKHFASKRYEEALSAYATVLELEQILDAGQSSADSSAARADAVENLRQVILACRLNSAQCALCIEDFHSAQQHAERVISVDPMNPKALFRLGQAQVGNGLFTDGIATLRQAVARVPETSKARVEKMIRIAEAKRKTSKRKTKLLGKKLLASSDLAVKALEKARKLDHRSLVFLELSARPFGTGRVEIELFDDIVPKLARNFRELCRGFPKPDAPSDEPSKLHFKGSKFHRIIHGFIMQGGDIVNGDGTGGCSIYGSVFPREKACVADGSDDEQLLTHASKPGVVSIAPLGGPDDNSSQFFITLAAAPHLDGRHQVFGRVVSGFWEVIQKISRSVKVDPKTSQPLGEGVVISDCGVLREPK